ncbi:MAG: hypothetical protein APR63_04545 [Desulfuromonas sp. SDB]|nr:MAG: hypothetical protein APR63_04545 [Desulfuromonas sp. SDB]
MEDDKKLDEINCHKKFAVDLFNLTWDYLDNKNRNRDQIDEMIHAAHASRFHWSRVGQPIHWERGEWQISRVYSELNMSESALYHAQRCVDICLDNGIGDFDIAFAYEAMARAHALDKNKIQMNKYLELAKKAGESIDKKEDRDYFFSELNSINIKS